jgi:transposase
VDKLITSPFDENILHQEVIKMLGVAMYTTIRTLFKKGLNKSEIARTTGHDWKTVNKVIKSGDKPPDKKPHPRILDPYREDVLEYMELGLNGVRIHEEMQRKGVKVGYTSVKEYIGDIKKRDDIFVRIHTKPGEEAQVDFGYFGRTLDNSGKLRKTWVFHMKMSYSRKDFYKKVYNQRVETFIECHEEAFKYFGGVPEYVRIDNLKAAVLEANFYEPVYQRLYQNFADHYGFKIIPCRVRHPNDKGKVESGVKYVKGNFIPGRTFKSGDDLDRQLYDWQENKCNTRVHGTTRKVPHEVFEKEEKNALKPLSLDKFSMPESSKRKVYHDCHIYVKYNYYSVPFEYIGKEVEIELTKDILNVHYHNKLIAAHPRITDEGKFSTIKSHYPKYKLYSETDCQEKYQVKMAGIGPYAEQLFFALVETQPKTWGKSTRGILSLLKKYPKDIIDLACKRALAFNAYKYQTVKNICENGAYALPVEFNAPKEVNTYEYA